MSEKTRSQLGALLRDARERRGVSVAQAAAETRILQRYILALEEGDYAHLPGDVYARGFIRNYAQYLELPAEEMVELYRAERGGSAPIRVMPAATPPRTRSCLAPSFFVVFFLVLGLAVVAYLVANALGLTRSQELAGTNTPTATIATPQPLATATAQTPVPTPVDGLIPTEPVGAGPGATPAAATPEAPVVVDIRVVDQPSWMLITRDGVQVVEGVQPAGWTSHLTGQNEIRIRVGNAGAVEISIQGQPYQRLGLPAEVRDITVRPEGIAP